jgi:hypothetical protein
MPECILKPLHLITLDHRRYSDIRETLEVTDIIHEIQEYQQN